MRRALDLVLVIVILAAVGYGAYQLGNLVDNKSHEAASESENTTPVTTTTGVKAASKPSNGPSRETVEMVIIAMAGAAGVMLAVQIGGTLVRTRKRERWHA